MPVLGQIPQVHKKYPAAEAAGLQKNQIFFWMVCKIR